jgi:MFS family permease
MATPTMPTPTMCTPIMPTPAMCTPIMSTPAMVTPAHPTGCRLSDRLPSRKAIMVPALAATACFSALQPMAADQYQFAVLVGATGLANSVWMPSVSPLLLDSTNEEERAKAFALRQMAQDTGSLVGAASMGLLAGMYGIPAAIHTTAVLQGAACAFFHFRGARGVADPDAG